MNLDLTKVELKVRTPCSALATPNGFFNTFIKRVRMITLPPRLLFYSDAWNNVPHSLPFTCMYSDCILAPERCSHMCSHARVKTPRRSHARISTLRLHPACCIMVKDVQVNMPVNVFNTLNYLLFDLVFAAAVQLLTADIAGLSNCSSLLSFSGEDLGSRKNPIAGPGIICTKRRVYYIVTSLRLASWLLIFDTSFFIIGVSRPVIVSKQANVTTLGNFSPYDDPFVLAKTTMLRRTCQGRYKNTAYYGEVRDGNCELNRDLLSDPVIQFGLRYEPTNVTYRSCYYDLFKRDSYICQHADGNRTIEMQCLDYKRWKNQTTCGIVGTKPLITCLLNEERNRYDANFTCSSVEAASQEKENSVEQLQCTLVNTVHLVDKRCENAMIGCFEDVHEEYDCVGAVSLHGVTYLCQNINPVKKEETILCKQAKGAEWNIHDWVLLYSSISLTTIEDAYALSYGSGLEKRVVKALDSRGGHHHLTIIQPTWFAILCVKLIAVASLLAISVFLRRWKGLHRVANDEYEMKRLLGAATKRISYNTDSLQEEDIYENEVFVELVSDQAQLSTNRRD